MDPTLKRLREILAENDLTEEDFSTSLEFGAEALSRLERAMTEAEPSATNTIAALAEARRTMESYAYGILHPEDL